jgi:hypothetical protein
MMEVQLPDSRITRCHVIDVADRHIAGVEVHQRSHARELQAHARGATTRVETFPQVIPPRIQAASGFRCKEAAHGDDAGRHGEDIVVERTGMRQGAGAARIEERHDLLAATERPERHAATDVLAQRR